MTDAFIDSRPRPAPASSGVVDECLSSPGLQLALLGHYAMRRLRDAHTAHNLSPRQFHLLGLLHDQGPTGQGELGQRMEVDASILVTMLNPLEAEGLISRERDLADRRRHLVRLTATGKERLIAAASAQREAENELFAGLEDGQREQLGVLLVALRDSLASAPAADCDEPSAPGADYDEL